MQQHGQVHVLFRIVEQHGGGIFCLRIGVAQDALKGFGIDQRGIDRQCKLAHYFGDGFGFGIAAHGERCSLRAIGQHHPCVLAKV